MEENNNKDLKYWIAFSRINGLGPINTFRLLDYFKNLKDAWSANNQDFLASGINEKLAKTIIEEKNKLNPYKELEILEIEKVSAITFSDDNYPRLLKQIYSPPPIIFYRGNIKIVKENCLAIVGARKNTYYGKQVIEKIIPGLISNNITIVSGLALGIDGIAHQTCLNHNGKTVGVLGSGVDKNSVYPTIHRLLAENILEKNGCLISEYAPGTMPSKQSFPLRNRIISGLSLGSLIIEAGESSGSLITAKYALEQNRDIFAIPGNIFNSQSKGTNNLIKQGAKLITCAEEIFDELNISRINPVQNNIGIELNSQESSVIKILSHEPVHIDKISQLCRINISVLSSLLIMLELKGIIKDIGGKNYIKN